MDEPILRTEPFSRRIFYRQTWLELFYALLCSILITFFILPPLCFMIQETLWLIFVEKDFELFLCLIAIAWFSFYIFWPNEGYVEEQEEEIFRALPSFYQNSDRDLQYHQPSSPPVANESFQFHRNFSPSSSPPVETESFQIHRNFSPPSSPPVEQTESYQFHRNYPPASPWPSNYPPASPWPSYNPPASPDFETYPPSSVLSSPPSSCPPSSPPSSPQLSTSSSISLSSPPPPPFRWKTWKAYAWLASDISLSSDSDTDTDVDIKADRFIAQFRDQLKKDRFKK